MLEDLRKDIQKNPARGNRQNAPAREGMPKVSARAERPPLWTADFILIFLSSLALVFAFNSLIPTLPVYISNFGGSTRVAGLAMAALTVAAVISRPFAGWALDAYGRKAIFLGGLLFFLLPLVIYIGMIPVVFLIILRFFQGLAWGVGNTASMTVASDVVPRERLGEGMGFFSVSLGVSMAIGPAFALWVIDAYSFPALFTACAVLIIISTVLAYFIKYPKMERRAAPPKPVFMEKAALRPTLVMLFVTISYSAPLSFLSLHASERGLATAGIFFTPFALTTLLSRPFSGIIFDRFGEKGYDLGTILGVAASIAATPFLALAYSPFYLVMGGILYGIGYGFLQSTMLILAISSVSPEKKGAANASFWTGYDIGVAAGSIAWGLVAARLGYSLMFNLTIFPLAAALFIYFFCFQEKAGLKPNRDDMPPIKSQR